MSATPTALTVLSAMITPAILIMACGSLILTTSQRLSRVIDRARRISERLVALAHTPEESWLIEGERAVLVRLLERAVGRARRLQRAMMTLYLSLGSFVATSAALGVVTYAGPVYAWMPLPLGALGTALLLLACGFLIEESRIALAAVGEETDFALRIGRRYSDGES